MDESADGSSSRADSGDSDSGGRARYDSAVLATWFYGIFVFWGYARFVSRLVWNGYGRARRRRAVFGLLCAVSVGSAVYAGDETAGGEDGGALALVRSTGRLRFGSDKEGGAPFLFESDLESGAGVGAGSGAGLAIRGFEVDLIEAICREVDPRIRAEFHQGQWDTLLSILGRGDVEVVMNGYEKTVARDERYLATRPYFVYQVQLVTRKDSPVRCWADVQFPKPGGGRWRIGVLGGTGAEKYARDSTDERYVQVVIFDGTTNALMSVDNTQIDATLQDLAPSIYYLKRPDYADLMLAGPPVGCGYYVIYLRPEDIALRDALDGALERLAASGELRRIYERWGIWNEAQEVIEHWGRTIVQAPTPPGPWFDFSRLFTYYPYLLQAAGMTAFLACTAMPLAIFVGMLIALGRVYGPRWLTPFLRGYVELVRGTPLMLQLYVLFYLLPEWNIFLPALLAGILGLAINYSAYEAEIYRSGLLAVPKGQMEAALSLGMSHSQALRRVILPQATRLVIPSVTNDFIAMFKDTSVCSVITLVELTKQFSILYNSHGGVVEFGLAAAFLYLAMSLPLSGLSHYFEQRLRAPRDSEKRSPSSGPPTLSGPEVAPTIAGPGAFEHNHGRLVIPGGTNHGKEGLGE